MSTESASAPVTAGTQCPELPRSHFHPQLRRLYMQEIKVGRSPGPEEDIIIAYALAAPGGPTGTFADRDGEVPW